MYSLRHLPHYFMFLLIHPKNSYETENENSCYSDAFYMFGDLVGI